MGLALKESLKDFPKVTKEQDVATYSVASKTAKLYEIAA